MEAASSRPFAVVTGASSGIGREKVVGGSFKNKVQTIAGKVIPDSKKAEIHRQMAEPGSAKEG
jgi:NAD(P)-dependent dehydrogenase (short-subunit alcohol dehydrogenase family)